MPTSIGNLRPCSPRWRPVDGSISVRALQSRRLGGHQIDGSVESPRGRKRPPPLGTPPPVSRSGNSIRIASFNIQVFGESKLADPTRRQSWPRSCASSTSSPSKKSARERPLRPAVLQKVNASGRHYDFVVGPRLGRTDSKEQYAYIFDTARIEVDRSKVYTVPDDRRCCTGRRSWPFASATAAPNRLSRSRSSTSTPTPTKPTSSSTRWTTCTGRPRRRPRRRRRDPAGRPQRGRKTPRRARAIPRIAWLVSGVPTNTRGTKTYDNILFDRHSTVEFIGRAACST